MRENPKYLEKTINYHFNDLGLLTTALTHRSYNDKHNERIEFLGDALLDLIIAEALFNQFRDAQEGQLTRLRANLVKKEYLISLAEKFNISNYILLGQGELKSGGLQRRSILADCIEAIIAAIYLDSDFTTCRKVVLAWYKDTLDKLDLASHDKDPKTILQEWLQARQHELPVYTIISETGSPHDKSFIVQCVIKEFKLETQAKAKSRRKAEQKAAEQAILKLTNQSSIINQ